MATYVILMNIGVVIENTCSFYQERDSIHHIFWRCACVIPFWQAKHECDAEAGTNPHSGALNESVVLVLDMMRQQPCPCSALRAPTFG